MHETDTTGDGVDRCRRVRRTDAPVALLAGTGDLLLCGVLFMMIIASGITFGGPDEVQQAEMDATVQLAERIYFGWLADGLLLFGLFRLPRSVLTHLVCMIVPPAALFAYLAAAG
jgi:hypothetical protein